MNQQNDNLQYVGSYSTLQTLNKNKYTDNVNPTYSKEQSLLYSRLLNGLKAYSKEELYMMNSGKKKRIKRVHKKAQQIINIWKQELMLKTVLIPKNTTINTGITKLFNSITIKDIKPDPSFFCTLKFRDLGLRKEDIIKKFIEEKLLPSDFYNR